MNVTKRYKHIGETLKNKTYFPGDYSKALVMRAFVTGW